jgi:hypothetical protein
MATGKQPFSGLTPASVFDAILNSDPAPVTRNNAAVPAELNEIHFPCARKKAGETVSEHE